MGVPSLFRIVISKYKNTHYEAKGSEKIDFLFMDYNCLIYHCLKNRMSVEHEKLKKGKITLLQFEDKLIGEVINYTVYIVTKISKPQKLLYIAIDGPPPRAKMVQQRMRRFKGIKEAKMKKELHDKFGIKEDNDAKSWNKSSITPGTTFMNKLAAALKATAEEGGFGKSGNGDGSNLRVIISDATVAGEGEHKIIPYMRKIKSNDDDVFSIYGLDADLIILAMDTYQKKIVLLREPQKSYFEEKLYGGKEFLYLDIENFRDSFVEELGLSAYELDRVINDFTFMTFFGGNDFIVPLPYLEVRNGGLDLLLGIYKKLLPEMDGHLVEEGKGGKGGKGGKRVNTAFFKAILEKLGMVEGKMLRLLQNKRDRYKHNDDRDPEDAMEREWSIIEHDDYTSKVHPQYEEYKERMRSINYKDPKDVWKRAYYKEFFQIDMESNASEFTKMRKIICYDYVESMLWTMKYYLEGIPSWTWFYKFRAAPFIGDLQSVLHGVDDLNKLGVFELGKPYAPLEQLMFVMPSGSNDLLPDSLSKMMSDVDSPIIEYYPIDFELDIMRGMKHVYSEPILPMIDDKHLLSVIQPVIKKLDVGDKGNNKINKKPDYFWFPSGVGKKKAATKIKVKVKSKNAGTSAKGKDKIKIKIKAKSKSKA